MGVAKLSVREKEDKLVNRLNVHSWYFGRGYINKVYMLACLKLSVNAFLYVNTKYGIANFPIGPAEEDNVDYIHTLNLASLHCVHLVSGTQ